MTKKVNFDQILKSQVVRPIVEFGLWTVNRKSEKCATLHSDFLAMSYELHIKMQFLVSLLLGDVNNFLIPPSYTLNTIKVRFVPFPIDFTRFMWIPLAITPPTCSAKRAPICTLGKHYRADVWSTCDT